ncbi:MAG: type II toxin-antitoxin system HicA family toxin [Gaiellaceae bacterium]
MADILNQKSAKQLAEENGWSETQGGKHNVKMEKAGCRPVTLPHHGGKDYGKDLSARIRKQLLNPTRLD